MRVYIYICVYGINGHTASGHVGRLFGFRGPNRKQKNNLSDRYGRGPGRARVAERFCELATHSRPKCYILTSILC